MQDAIRFLERLGQDVAVGSNAYAALLDAEVAEGAARRALLERDVGALNALSGGTAPWFCMVATPDGDESERPQEAPDGEREDRGDTDPDPERREAPDSPD
ncbi:hypothetical protein ACOPJQ_12830 [Luteimonas dalianensis]|uniref:hypothetical protein n=1 Tax=Luteimonas dalianensis TaxID=1148196 RepID=UPI003BF43602